MASPVWGLRAVRALRATRSNERKPDRTIFSPFETFATTTSSRALRTSATVFLFAPLSATIASTNSALFTGRLLTLHETDWECSQQPEPSLRKTHQILGFLIRFRRFERISNDK